MTHIPGNISTQQVGVQDPEGGWLQVSVALTRCSCGKIHASIGEDPAKAYNEAVFWLGVKYSQLNKWTELEVAGADTGEDEAQ